MTNSVRIPRNRRPVFNWLGKFIAIFAFTILVCAEASAVERIRIGLSVRNVVFLPFYYAQEKAIYEKYGLHAELIQMRSDLQTVGLVSGEIDFTPVIGPAVAAIANGMPLRAVAVMYRAPVFSLVSPGPLTQIKDLEGRQVAVSRLGSDSHRYAVMMMQNSGVDVRRVTFIQTGSTTVSLAALQQGAVAAAVLSPPFTGSMAEKGYRILARTRSLVELPWMGMVTSKQKIEKQPDQVQNVLRSLRDTLAIIRRDKPGIVAYIEGQFKVTPTVAAEAYDDINGIMVDNLVMPEEPIKKFLEAMHSRGDIPRSLAPADAFDFALVKNLN